ncbi:GNAT family N-acetyltransferase [Lichenihabitans sp. Uapishka_5]|uniref:GNAT family N-acetyltransferase n=1 Tax=Lichenihabitans sp. Uapishka_5 TaxID=3037302 RepID=UPI0029E81959|nr:GNAT family N-acetyltransferase [Lichenihabitans sp. Uapishka_5]MDX7952044.1 GNAT family N-acetyltransferase [Lichenihabitans sp. Uapishka_5]
MIASAGARAAKRGLTPDAMACHGAAWRDLAARALEPSIFNDPGFAMPAAQHLPGRRRPRFLLSWDPSDPARLIGLCCVAPQGLVPLRSAWLHPQATAAFPLLDAAHAATALADLLAQAGGPMRPAGLLLHGMPQHGATLQLIAAQPGWTLVALDARSRAVVRQPPPPLPGKAGKEFRRQARRLAEQGRVATTVSAEPDDVDRFLAFEAAGWKGRRGTALGVTPRVARFTRTMAAALTAEERCHVHSLTLDGRPIAMGVVLRAGPNAFFWKTSFDEAWARFSPGAHLTVAIGEAQARDPDVAMTDSCAVPGHSMIDRLWPERMTVVDGVLALTPTRRPSWSTGLLITAERLRRMARLRAKRVSAALRSRRHNATMAQP